MKRGWINELWNKFKWFGMIVIRVFEREEVLGRKDS